MTLPPLLLDIRDFFWKPRWKKEAIAIAKGGRKFLNYNRDRLELDRIKEIDARVKDLKGAIRRRETREVKEAEKQLIGTCEHSLKSYRAPDALAENLEVIFVTLALALGIRAYYTQPFRIPTGSMQPTLNGIVGFPVEDDPDWQKPNLLTQGFKKLTQGRTYIKAVAKADTQIVDIREERWMWFFTKTDIYFANGQKQRLNGSKNAIVDGLGLGKNLDFYSQTTAEGRHYFHMNEQEVRARGGRPRQFNVQKGQILAQGWVDTGDLVFVDRVSYHFRKPRRGEVFVFETRGIGKIQSEAQNRDQEAGSHYIKRLAGVPGDTLRLDAPNLWHNGKLAQEDAFKRVMSQEDGYPGYTTPRGQNANYLLTPTDNVTIGPDQYFAMGDNSPSSSDSRYWGQIDEYLLIGPGLFTLWPLENFGFIR